MKKIRTLSIDIETYENRSNPDYQKLTLNLRSILFAQREDVI